MFAASAFLAVPSFSQQKIEEAFRQLTGMQDIVVEEGHYRSRTPSATGRVPHTDVYELRLAKKDVGRIDRLKAEFDRSREAATKDLRRSAGMGTGDKAVILISSDEHEVSIGRNPASGYIVMAFPDIADTTGVCRSVYAMEWTETADGAAGLTLVSVYGPDSKKSVKTSESRRSAVVKEGSWLYNFNTNFGNVRKFIEHLGKGQTLVFPTLLFETCGDCPLDDAETRKSLADEVRKVADMINSKEGQVNRAILMKAAKALDE